MSIQHLRPSLGQLTAQFAAGVTGVVVEMIAVMFPDSGGRLRMHGRSGDVVAMAEHYHCRYRQDAPDYDYRVDHVRLSSQRLLGLILKPVGRNILERYGFDDRREIIRIDFPPADISMIASRRRSFWGPMVGKAIYRCSL
jgi:hypothetical protein